MCFLSKHIKELCKKQKSAAFLFLDYLHFKRSLKPENESAAFFFINIIFL